MRATTETYRYDGTSETVTAIENQANATRLSVVDAAGTRLATKDAAATTGFLVPDPHGNVAAVLASASGTVINALRYDAYGQTLGTPFTASGTGLANVDWRYQGRQDLSPAGDPLYEFSAREYSPALGTFTSLDSYAGQAVDPLSMNRFLYAHANPATLIDPTGHAPQLCFDDCTGNFSDRGISGTTPTGQGNSNTWSSGPGNTASYQAPPPKKKAGGAAPPTKTTPTGGTEGLRASDQWYAWAGYTGNVEAPSRPTMSLDGLACHPGVTLGCSLDEINALGPEQRLAWMQAFQKVYGTEGWINALEGFVEIGIKRGTLGKDQFLGQVDANVIAAIQGGMSIYRTGTGDTSAGGGREFAAFFDAFYSNSPDTTLVQLGVAAEQAAVDAGVTWATAQPTLEDRFMLGAADAWRTAARSGVVGHYGAGGIQDHVLTPKSRALPAAVHHYDGAVMAVGVSLVAIGDTLNSLASNLFGS